MIKACTWLPVLLTAWMATAAPTVEVLRHPAPNLLDNPGFEQLDAAGNPVDWEFADMANSGKIHAFSTAGGAGGGNAVKIVTPGNLPGYWTHRRPVPVREGERYFASVKFKAAGPRVLLWLRTEQYQDGKSSLFPPWSQTEIFSQGDGSQGEDLRDQLGLFIPAELVRVIGAREWHTFTMEFTVPAGHGVTDYTVRAGAFFGASGWLMIDDVYFGLAACEVELNIAGSGLTQVQIVAADGEVAATLPLDPELEIQSVTAALPSSQKHYRLKLTGGDNVWEQEL